MVRLKLAAARNARSADCPNPQRLKKCLAAGLVSMLVCQAMRCEFGQLTLRRLTLTLSNLTLSADL
jgi:hypothetical protein